MPRSPAAGRWRWAQRDAGAGPSCGMRTARAVGNFEELDQYIHTHTYIYIYILRYRANEYNMLSGQRAPTVMPSWAAPSHAAQLAARLAGLRGCDSSARLRGLACHSKGC